MSQRPNPYIERTLELSTMNDLHNINELKSIPSIWAETRDAGFTMASEPLTCSLLRTLAASKPAAKFLELGSGTGLSTAWLLDGMDSESIESVTIDLRTC